MKKLILYIVQNLVKQPDFVSLSVTREGDGEKEKLIFTLKVHPDDKSLVIGKDGKILQSIKTIASAYAHKKVHIKVEEK